MLGRGGLPLGVWGVCYDLAPVETSLGFVCRVSVILVFRIVAMWRLRWLVLVCDPDLSREKRESWSFLPPGLVFPECEVSGVVACQSLPWLSTRPARSLSLCIAGVDPGVAMLIGCRSIGSVGGLLVVAGWSCFYVFCVRGVHGDLGVCSEVLLVCSCYWRPS